MRWPSGTVVAGSIGAMVGICAAVAVVVIDSHHVGNNAPSSNNPGFAPKTAEYYMAHRDEMKAREKQCSNQGIGPMGDSPQSRDCNAAEEAERRIFFGGQG